MTAPVHFNFDHVMIDIETMSLSKHNALILSIGMIEFEPCNRSAGVEIGARSLLVLDIPEQIMLGREITKSTQKWWSEQPPEASEHWRNPDAVYSVNDAMERTRDFCKGKSRVWANGNQFDLANLEQLARDVGQTAEMWHYRAPRDMRSFVYETPQARVRPDDDENTSPFIAHHPVHDAVQQAWAVWQHWVQ